MGVEDVVLVDSFVLAVSYPIDNVAIDKPSLRYVRDVEMHRWGKVAPCISVEVVYGNGC